MIILIYYINKLIYLYITLLLVYALMSWFPNAYDTALGRILSKICEPYLNLFRKLPLQFMGLDFSVLVGMLALEIVQQLLVKIILF